MNESNDKAWAPEIVRLAETDGIERLSAIAYKWLGGRPAEIPFVVNGAFIRGGPRYDGSRSDQSSPITYLSNWLRAEISAVLRPPGCRFVHVSLDDEDSDLPVFEESGLSEVSNRIEAAVSECLRAAIARLPEIQRQVIIMKYYEDMDYAEISQALNRPIALVYLNHHRALKGLEKYLRDKLRPEDVI